MKLVSAALCLMSILPASNLLAGPSVVPTSEGQIGEIPDSDTRLIGSRVEFIRGSTRDIISGGLFIPPGQSPEFSFITDRIHGSANPNLVGTSTGTLNQTFPFTPSSARSRNASDDGDFVAFAFAIDGSMPETITVRIPTFDEVGNSLSDVTIADVPNVTLPETGVAIDSQGRVTVVYSEVPVGGVPVVRVNAQRFNALTGAIIDSAFEVNVNNGIPDVALLDPAGNRLVVASTDLQFGTIQGNIIDYSSGAPVVTPSFEISTTPGIPNLLAKVAGNPSDGGFMAVWENLTGVVGDPVNIRGRRFDANGNPIGGEFLVNTTTADAQGQPDIATDPSGITAVVWAGDATGVENLDVFGQVYDAMGNPIGGEFRVNSFDDRIQDRPTVGFLPETDALGQTQFVTSWRDVENSDGSGARGTGTSYRCFSIGLDPTEIFADGFESGDTSSWSDDTLP